MTRLIEFKAGILQLRNDIDRLTSEKDYSVEDVAAKAAELHELLKIKPDGESINNELSEFLMDNLQWIATVVSRISEEKNNVASDIIRSQRHQKADKLYGENK